MLREVLAVAGERRSFQPTTNGAVACEPDATDRQWRRDFEIKQNEPPFFRARGEKELVELAGDVGADQVERRLWRFLLAGGRFRRCGFADFSGSGDRHCRFACWCLTTQQGMSAYRRCDFRQISGQLLNNPQRR